MVSEESENISALKIIIFNWPLKYFIRILSARGDLVLKSYRRYEKFYVYPNFIANMRLPMMLNYNERKKIWRKCLIRKIKEEERISSILRANLYFLRLY